jgi:hypothetical protein
MIHASERHVASRLLEQFFKGEITNEGFDNEYPVRSGDAGLDVVYDRIWLYYDDFAALFLRKEELTLQDRQLFERCIAFLRTDFEYEGPLLNRGLPFYKRLIRLAVGLFSGQRKADGQFLSAYWPFATAEQYRQVQPGALS